MSNSLLQAVLAHFDSVFEGPNGDYPALLEALTGVTAMQAAWKPGSDCNSIWQIVDHSTASKLWQIDMLEKGQAAPPTGPSLRVMRTIGKPRSRVSKRRTSV